MFNIGTDQFGTMFEALDHLCAYAGTGATVRSLPAKPTALAMRASAALHITPFAPYHWLMYSKSMWFDIEHAREQLGWNPKWSTDEMFRQSYDWYVAHREETSQGASEHRRSARQGALALLKHATRLLPRATGATVSDLRNSQWWRLMWHALPAYVLSRLCVLAGAAVVAAELRVDVNLADERGLPLADPHILDGSVTSTTSAVRPMLDVLTSWDGLWYMDIVRHGYPREVPPNVTYHVDAARAAFFPLFPMLGRAADIVLPGGDSFAVLTLNTVLGFIAVVLIALLAAKLYGERVGRTTATLVALFPGSFVLTFAYSEALMLVLAAAALLCLLDRRWLLAGVFAALDDRHTTERDGDRGRLRGGCVHGDPRGPRLASVVVGAAGADRIHRLPDLARPAHR